MEIKKAEQKKAELYFYGDIVSNTWQSYFYEEDKCPQDIVDFLNQIDDNQDIDVFINSPGGSVHAGLAIHNILKRHKGYKTAHVDGIAASIATIILFACDKVIAPEKSQIMVHKPWSIMGGNAEEHRKEAEVLDNCLKTMMSVYMENVKEGITEDSILEMLEKETWLTGDQAAQYFNIEIEETDVLATNTRSAPGIHQAVAYRNLSWEQADSKDIDYHKLADLIASKTIQVYKAEEKKKDERKKSILEGLESI